MKDRLSVHHPKKYDGTSTTVVKSSLVIAWGDYDQTKVTPNQIFGLLLAIEPKGAKSNVIKGRTHVVAGDVWVVVFEDVPQGYNYRLEVWKAKKDSRDAILLRLGPIAVDPTLALLRTGIGILEITLTSPLTGAQVFAPTVVAGGADTDYVPGTCTFHYGPWPQGQQPADPAAVPITPGTPSQQYWLASIPVTAPPAGMTTTNCTCTVTNGISTTTNNQITLNPNASAPGAGAGDG